MASDNITFKSLINELHNDERLSDLEKCVVLLQILLCRNDIYDKNIMNYPGNFEREIYKFFN